MKLSLLSFFVAVFFMSCQQQSAIDTEKSNFKKDYFEPGKEYVHMIPDSIRTAEQQAVFDMLQQEIPRIIGENVVVENGHFVFKMTREEFAATGIPVQYYDLLLKDIKNNNDFLDTADLDQSVEEIWENSIYGNYKKEANQDAEQSK